MLGPAPIARGGGWGESVKILGFLIFYKPWGYKELLDGGPAKNGLPQVKIIVDAWRAADSTLDPKAGDAWNTD